MPTDPACTDVVERIEAAFWSHTAIQRADLAHADSCASCADLIATLEALARSFSTSGVQELGTDRARSIRFLVARELASSTSSREVEAPSLPTGYLRELFRILGWAMLPLPLVLFVYVQLFQFGGALLGQILPDWGVLVVGITAASAAASWLAIIYGSIPLVAYRRLSVNLRPSIEVGP